ncbi:acyl-CoA thioesterase [Falsiroseomonas sp. CW058]|uniref:acyl-CoA thioesterase n=1 Tax=Falsiroseomonas sp. CW058 TaxID=3388664 RepID=UPI003D312CA3
MTDAAASRAPFVHARQVHFGECDPARIVYTPRFLDFAMEAVDAFFRERLGAGFYELNADHGIGTPFVRVELDFRSPVTPRDVLATEVRVARLGGGSLHLALTGRVGGRVAFESRLVCAFVAGDGTAMRPIRVPDRFRGALQPDP